MERLNFEDDRLWKGLLALGILLNILVCFTSDLGLDTQVKMAVDENGALPWGDLRPDTIGESDPDDGGQRTVLPLYGFSETGIKVTALLTFIGLIACLVGSEMCIRDRSSQYTRDIDDSNTLKNSAHIPPKCPKELNLSPRTLVYGAIEFRRRPSLERPPSAGYSSQHTCLLY